MQAFGKGRIAFLNAELAVTPALQPAWDAYAAAIKNFASRYARDHGSESD